jgi:ribonuclease H2 subunit A
MGIDEAGRGPVLGPMVYGSAWCPLSRADDLAKLGFADSKQLTADQRTSLLTALKACDYIGWIADIISPETLSAKMTRRYKYNLNAISHDSAIGMIQNALDQGVNLSHVYLDTVGDPGRYQQKLCGIFPSIQFTVSKKADSLFPVVSAASIVAKVTRDGTLCHFVIRISDFV